MKPFRPKRPEMQPHLLCRQCGETFIQRRKWQKFCSQACRWANWDERHPRVKASEIVPGS